MNEGALDEKIREELLRFFEGSEFFIVDIKVLPRDQIKVFVDGEKNIPINECVRISRHLEQFLETNGLVPENYNLEVSSPGMDQPLKVPEQFRKSLGRQVEVVMKDGQKLEGTLLAADEIGIRLNVEKRKKGKLMEAEERDLPFVEIKSTSKKITFK